MNESKDKKPENHKEFYYESYFSENPEIKRLQTEALEAHLLFDENRCYRFPPNVNFDVKKHKLSFHNFEHIKTAVEGAMILFDEAFKNNNDIFNLKADFDKWNQGKGEEEKISFEELADVFRLAFSFHDLAIFQMEK